jgi:AraC-like DNA-binding protein
VPLNLTAVAPVKLVPVTVTLVPAGPLGGLKLAIEGGIWGLRRCEREPQAVNRSTVHPSRSSVWEAPEENSGAGSRVPEKNLYFRAAWCKQFSAPAALLGVEDVGMSVGAGRRMPFGGRTDSFGRLCSGQIGEVLWPIACSILEERSVELTPGAGLALVVRGLDAAASVSGLSGRTVKRRFEAVQWTASAFVKEVRRRAARSLIARGWRTDRIARILGYSSPSSLRRFLGGGGGEGVEKLRRSGGIDGKANLPAIDVRFPQTEAESV